MFFKGKYKGMYPSARKRRDRNTFILMIKMCLLAASVMSIG